MIPDSPYTNLIRLGRYTEAEEWRLALDTLEKKTDFGCWDSDWDRDGVTGVHQNTRHFPIIWEEAQTSMYSYFEHLLEPLANKMRSHYGEGFFRKLIITKQDEMSMIFPHRDNGALFQDCHRCHLPLYTGNTYDYGSVIFNIGYIDREDYTTFKPQITKRWIAETVPMCADELWEINNSPKDRNLRHSVMNYSYDKVKIHVIMDWRPDNFVSSFSEKESELR